MTLEITAEGLTLIVTEISPANREMLIAPIGFRWFWRERLIECINLFLPHAHVEIQSVKVSEPK